MKFRKLFFYCVSIGVLAGIVDLITNVLQSSGIIAAAGSLTFVSFITWATYFLIGANPKAAGKALASMAAGILGAILMFSLVGVFAGAGMDVGLLAIPLAVTIGIFLLLFLEKVPLVNNIAAVFLGTAMFFGLMGAPAIAKTGSWITGLGELLYAVIGFVAGWLTVLIRVAIQNSGKKSHEVSM